jgi:hypothetical protein
MEPDGRWVKDDVAGATRPRARPRVTGASANATVSSAVMPCPLATVKVTVVRADNQQPIRGVAVRVSGGLDQGPLRTNGAGEATFAGLLPGSYQVSVSIPRARERYLREPPVCGVEAAPWSTHAVTIMVPPVTPWTAEGWIRIKLVDERGSPVPNEKYQITFPDGTVAVGSLDAKGVARYDYIPPGECEVSFTDLDPSSWRLDAS